MIQLQLQVTNDAEIYSVSTLAVKARKRVLRDSEALAQHRERAGAVLEAAELRQGLVLDARDEPRGPPGVEAGEQGTTAACEVWLHKD